MHDGDSDDILEEDPSMDVQDNKKIGTAIEMINYRIMIDRNGVGTDIDT